MDKATYTKVRFKCKKVKFISPLLTKRCTLIPNFLFGFKFCVVSRNLKDTSQQNLDAGNLRSDMPVMHEIHSREEFGDAVIGTRYILYKVI